MLKHTLIAGALLASVTSAQAQAGDPTFNGLVAREACYIRIVTTCRSGSCEQVERGCQGDLCGELNLFMKSSEFSFVNEKKPLRITGVSPPAVGKPLWVTFQLPFTDGGSGEGKLTLQPSRLGGYVGSAVVYAPTSGDTASRSFTLIDYDCEQISDEP